MSEYPLPTVVTGGDNIISGGVSGDWFISIQRELRWNERKEQKPLPPEVYLLLLLLFSLILALQYLNL